MNYISKFFGDHKIIEVKKIERKTLKDGDVLEIKFEDNEIREIPEKELEEFITDELVDATTFREKRADKLTIKILELLLESEIQIEWIGYILQKLQKSINMSIDCATDKLWQKKFINLTLQDVNAILQNNRNNQSE
jgi:hypothetical protein